MGIDVEIDRDVCMGSGNCTYEAPGVFDLDDDGVAVVINSPPPRKTPSAQQPRVPDPSHHDPARGVTPD